MGCVCALRAWTGPRCDRLRALALRVRQETHRVRREGRPPLVAGTKLFFADFYYGAIFSVATDGVGGAIRLVDGGRQPRWVAVDDVHVHWTNDQTGTVWLANKDGTGAKQIAVTTGVGQIVADGTNIYWVETFARRLMKAAKDGSGSTQVGPLLPSAGGGSRSMARTSTSRSTRALEASGALRMMAPATPCLMSALPAAASPSIRPRCTSPEAMPLRSNASDELLINRPLF